MIQSQRWLFLTKLLRCQKRFNPHTFAVHPPTLGAEQSVLFLIECYILSSFNAWKTSELFHLREYRLLCNGEKGNPRCFHLWWQKGSQSAWFSLRMVTIPADTKSGLIYLCACRENIPGYMTYLHIKHLPSFLTTAFFSSILVFLFHLSLFSIYPVSLSPLFSTTQSTDDYLPNPNNYIKYDPNN